MKAMKLLYRISNGMVYAISFVILAILTIKNLIFSTYVMNIKEHIRIRNTNVWMTAVFMIGLVLLFYLLFKFSERIDEKKLFLFFSVIYLVAGIYMIININSVLDMMHCLFIKHPLQSIMENLQQWIWGIICTDTHIRLDF